MQCKDYYRILDVEEDATSAQIKAAYRRLARKYHPDVSVIQDAEERFKEVLEAYDTLRDPIKRIAYDRLGYCNAGGNFRPAPDRERQFGEFFSRDQDGPSACGLDDILAMFTRDVRRDPFGACATGEADFAVTAQVTLEELAHGAALELALPPTLMKSADREMPRTVRVHIPQGACDGQVLHVEAADLHGDQHDLYVRIALRPHRHFRVDGHDLTLDVPVTPWEAALGTTLEVPTLEGRVKLRIPPGSQSQQKLRLAGRGLPKGGGCAGDLYASLRIVTPSVLSDRERELYAELARASTFEPRTHLA